MLYIIKKLNNLLSNREKIYLIIILIFSIVVSAVEVIGIGIIMPFIAVATDFNNIYKNQILNYIYNGFNFRSPELFIISFGIFLIIFYLLRGGLNLYYFYLLARFSRGRYDSLAYRLFKNYLGMYYIDFINTRSSELIKTIINEASYFVSVIQNALFILSEVLVLLFIYIFLLYVNWKLTISLTIFLTINLVFLRKFITPKIKKAGNIRNKMQQELYDVMINAFGNIKLVKLRNIDDEISNKFRESTRKFSKAIITSTTLAHFPRLFLETISFSLLALIVIYLVWKYNKNISFALPILSAFVLGLYRLMPSINRIYTNYNNIVFYSKSVENIDKHLFYATEKLGNEEITFEKELKIENVSFEYKRNKPVLKNINLVIKKGEKIGIIGKSGSGKSTLIDIIIGLFKPTKGKIYIDNVELNEKNIKSWRKKIGYIPQSIYLFEGTVAENVALEENFDEDKVKEVLRIANILEFLEKEHEGIYTKVGENGVKLSGGQKQRIAIARALYNDPEVLILDEATSALDHETEEKIMNEIYKISESKTLIIVAHRLSTLDRCDRIIKIERGGIK